MLAGGVSCLKTELDRHCAMAAGKLQITEDKGVGIVDANELSTQSSKMCDRTNGQ